MMDRRSDQGFTVPILLLSQKAVDEAWIIQLCIDDNFGRLEDAVLPEELAVLVQIRPTLVIRHLLDRVFKFEEKSEQRVVIEHQSRERGARSRAADQEEWFLHHVWMMIVDVGRCVREANAGSGSMFVHWLSSIQ